MPTRKCLSPETKRKTGETKRDEEEPVTEMKRDEGETTSERKKS